MLENWLKYKIMYLFCPWPGRAGASDPCGGRTGSRRVWATWGGDGEAGSPGTTGGPAEGTHPGQRHSAHRERHRSGKQRCSVQGRWQAGGRSLRFRRRVQFDLFKRDWAVLSFVVVVVYLQSEKEELDARFTKLKLQAKAKMASLNKQISELKGQGGATVSLEWSRNISMSKSVRSDWHPFGLQQSPESSFTGGAEEELQELKNKLSEEEVNNRQLQERLRNTEQLLEEKEAAYNEQVTWKFVNFLISLTFRRTSDPVVVLFPSCWSFRLWSARRTCVSRSRSRNTKKSCWMSRLSLRMMPNCSRYKRQEILKMT